VYVRGTKVLCEHGEANTDTFTWMMSSGGLSTGPSMEAEMSGGDVSAGDEGENMGRKNIIIPGDHGQPSSSAGRTASKLYHLW
jgi:hypothetical protein